MQTTVSSTSPQERNNQKIKIKKETLSPPSLLNSSKVYLEDKADFRRKLCFDMYHDADLPFTGTLDPVVVKQKRSVENDYDSDKELVKRAKDKMKRDLRQAVSDYLETKVGESQDL